MRRLAAARQCTSTSGLLDGDVSNVTGWRIATPVAVATVGDAKFHPQLGILGKSELELDLIEACSTSSSIP
jgi:hypothetical protein